MSYLHVELRITAFPSLNPRKRGKLNKCGCLQGFPFRPT
jgi:hypothetical protein